MFYFDEINGQKILRSDILDKNKGVDVFFTTRRSSAPSQISDIQAKLSYRDFTLPLGEGFASRIIRPEQTHSDHVEIVDERIEYPDTDGLIITEPDTAICLKFADCTPLVFYDPVHKIGAISHAGWRGTASRIGVKTVAKMALNFSSDPKDIIAIIGPAISLCCYEVSEEVKEALLSTVKDTQGLYENRNVDLKKINARQLEEIGVKKIDICPYCTSCNNDLFYSYRKENGTKERHFAILKLENT